jgi:hypothetical protein
MTVLYQIFNTHNKAEFRRTSIVSFYEEKTVMMSRYRKYVGRVRKYNEIILKYFFVSAVVIKLITWNENSRPMGHSFRITY